MDSFIGQIFIQSSEQFSLWILLITFTGGIISSISPCTLGILPVIIGYIGGYSESTTIKTIIQLIFFVIGMSGVLTLLGVTAALTGQFLGFHSNPLLGIILASVILVMGLSLLEIIEIPMPVFIKKMPQGNKNNVFLYPLMLGGAFSLASTPCSTPILGGIMAYASFKANILAGGLMLFLYALGQSVIIIFAGLFTAAFKKVSFIKSYSSIFTKVCGVVLILASGFLYLKMFNVI